MIRNFLVRFIASLILVVGMIVVMGIIYDIESSAYPPFLLGGVISSAIVSAIGAVIATRDKR